MSYVVQGLWSDGHIVAERTVKDEATAVSEARRDLVCPFFEGDAMRIITSDGDLVWDSRAE